MTALTIEREADPPGLTLKEEKELKYQTKLKAKLEKVGWLHRQVINMVEGLKFWRYDAKCVAVWTASSNVTLLQIIGGKWIMTNWTLLVLPFIKQIGLAVKSGILATLALVNA